MSHEGILYCKPHHKELFLPKAARNDAFDVETMSKTQEAIMKHQEQQRKHETIIRESNPVELEGVVKCSTNDKYSGLENLDVGSKFKMFEQTEDDERGPSSDRYGIDMVFHLCVVVNECSVSHDDCTVFHIFHIDMVSLLNVSSDAP